MSSVYVVTGASRGIGLEFVRQIASRKDQSIVFACARDPSSSQDLQSIIIGSNRRVFAIKLDITDQASIKVR
jgi:NAD(P)-dependent dehydrogenase (short-subunit alcohol dehydrogenase family)